MKPLFKKLVTIFGASFLTLVLLGAFGLLAAYIYITPRLPEIDTLKDVKLQVPLRVYAQDGELIAEFGEMKRSPMDYKDFPARLIQAVLAAEDDRFFEHPGGGLPGYFTGGLSPGPDGGEGAGRQYHHDAGGA